MANGLVVGSKVVLNLNLAYAHGMIKNIPAEIFSGPMNLTYLGYYPALENRIIGDDGIQQENIELAIVKDHLGAVHKVPKILLLSYSCFTK